MTERWSVGMLGAIGSASGGVSAATASIIGGGERLLAGTVTGVGTGGLIATLLFLASRDRPAFDGATCGPRPLRDGHDGGVALPCPGVAGRFAHHVVQHPETGPSSQPAAGPDHGSSGQNAAGQSNTAPAPAVADTEANELLSLLGSLLAEDDRAWAESTENDDPNGGTGSATGHRGGADTPDRPPHGTASADADWPASLAAILGEALPDPAPEGARELERRDGANPTPDQGPTTTERPPESSRLCPPAERRAESGCWARDRSNGLEHGLRDGRGRNRRRHRPH